MTSTATKVVAAAVALEAAISSPEALCKGYKVLMTPAEAEEFMEHFYGPSDLIECIDNLVPRAYWRGENPETDPGHVHHLYEVGLEGSRVLYLKVAKNYTPDKTPEFWDGVIESLRKLAYADYASEFEVKENNPLGLTIRMWWD